jgi:transglutaminase-like putative cysteine protease
VRERDLPEVAGHDPPAIGAGARRAHGTMLRNDIFDFCRLGTFLERADNTARILDVKYYVLLPSISPDRVLASTTCNGRRSCARSRGLYEQSTPSTKPGAGVTALTRGVEGETPLERLHALSARIREAVTYEIGGSEPTWTTEEVIEAGKGVCQDHAHVFVACARRMGLPARYVSGYLMLDDRVDQDAMHAWAEAYIPDLGWVGFDVSNGISPDTRYVRVATGLDYKDAAPVTGTRQGGAGETLSVDLSVAQQ